MVMLKDDDGDDEGGAVPPPGIPPERWHEVQNLGNEIQRLLHGKDVRLALTTLSAVMACCIEQLHDDPQEREDAINGLANRMVSVMRTHGSFYPKDSAAEH